MCTCVQSPDTVVVGMLFLHCVVGILDTAQYCRKRSTVFSSGHVDPGV